MAGYTHKNLTEVADSAPDPGFEAHFSGRALDLERTGLTLFRFEPNARVPFGHSHGNGEEVYVVVSGSARIKIEDEIVDLARWDAVRVPGEAMRTLAAGPEGAEVIAFGERSRAEGGETVMGWWSD